MGITFKGKGLEKHLAKIIEFLEGLPGNDPRGDLKSNHELMKGAFLEAKSNAWNQVRVWKYLVHVGFVDGDYYVVPPHVLVEKAIDRKGQHTYNSFECIGLGRPSRTGWFGAYRVAEKDLAHAIIDAYQLSHSTANLKYRDFAHASRERLESLTEQLKQEARIL